jgi:hypothetical protein
MYTWASVRVIDQTRAISHKLDLLNINELVQSQDNFWYASEVGKKRRFATRRKQNSSHRPVSLTLSVVIYYATKLALYFISRFYLGNIEGLIQKNS